MMGMILKSVLMKTPSVLLLLGFLYLLAYALQSHEIGWYNTIAEAHGFRQTQTAISAFYMIAGGPWLLYETPVLGLPWSIPFEFPLFQWLAALLTLASPLELDQSGRALSLLFFYLTFWPMRVILRDFGVGRVASLLFMIPFIVAPIHLFWARTFMIETASVFWSAAYLALVSRACRTKNTRYFFWGGIIGVLAALQKITTFFPFCLLAGCYVAYTFLVKARPVFSRSNISYLAYGAVLLAVIPLACVGAWSKVADLYRIDNPIAATFISMEHLNSWNFGTVHQKLSLVTWERFYNVHVKNLLGEKSFFWFIVAGLMIAHRYAIFGLLCLLAYGATLATFTNLFYVHDYYGVEIGIFLVFALGFNLLALWEKPGVIPKWATFIFLGTLSYFALEDYKSGYLKLQQNYDSPGLRHIGEIVKAHTKPDDVIMIWGADWDSSIAYYTERRALMDRKGRTIDDPVMVEARRQLKDAGYEVGALIFCWYAKKPEFIKERTLPLGVSDEPDFEANNCKIHLAREQPVGETAKAL